MAFFDHHSSVDTGVIYLCVLPILRVIELSDDSAFHALLKKQHISVQMHVANLVELFRSPSNSASQVLVKKQIMSQILWHRCILLKQWRKTKNRLLTRKNARWHFFYNLTLSISRWSKMRIKNRDRHLKRNLLFLRNAWKAELSENWIIREIGSTHRWSRCQSTLELC